LLRVTDGDFDPMIVSVNLEHADGLRLCSQVRSLDGCAICRSSSSTSQGSTHACSGPRHGGQRLCRAPDRVKRKRYIEHLRVQLEQNVEMVILDRLTGLHNRRYMTGHLATLFDEASQRGKSLSVLLIDIDHFKLVYDSHSHDVLREFATRIRRNTRQRSCLPARR
jgi:two-component system cell cycle response regulator